MISHRVWRDHFRSAPAVAGTVIRVDSKPLTVVGVAPVGFTGATLLAESDLWIPMGANDADLSAGDWDNWVAMIGRLRPGVDIRTAGAAVDVVATTVPPDESQTTVRGAEVAWATGITRNARSIVAGFLGMLLGLAALVLSIAAANIAGMLMSRTSARGRELAVRLAIGAGRMGLVRHLVAESLVIFALGGVLGVGLAFAGTSVLSLAPIPPPLNIALDVRPDGTVFLFALAVTVVAGLAASLFPALHASRPDLVRSLKDGGAAGPAARTRLRSAFVSGQVAMASLLLLVATLFARSLQTAMDVDLGFRDRGVVVAATNLGTHGYSVQDGRAFYETLRERLVRTPGVESVGLAQFVPLNGDRASTDVHNGIDGEGYRRTNSAINVVDPHFFETMGVEVVAGRGIRDSDAVGTPEVAVINQTLADRIWPGTNPIGRRLRMGGREVEVVGVTRDGRYTFVAEGPTAFTWLALEQNYRGRMSVHVRAPGSEAGALEAIREIVRDLDADVAVEGARPLAEVVDVSLFPQRFAAALIGIFGFIGLVLSALGVYGVLSFQVAQRTRELGVRKALGATGTDLVRQVITSGVKLSILGCAVGLVFGGAASAVLSTFLVGLATFDTVTFIGVPTVLLAVAIVASAFPALRATTVHATEALRQA